MKTINFKGHAYPLFQAEGFAAQFAIPYASKVCKGQGVDIGCNRVEWALPGAMPVDVALSGTGDAFDIPDNLDYVFSSHCLEHLTRWAEALIYWHSKLNAGGVMFLYLPDFSQVYWRPWHNMKHVASFTPEIIRGFFEDHGMENIHISGTDLNNSFMAMATKAKQ